MPQPYKESSTFFSRTILEDYASKGFGFAQRLLTAQNYFILAFQTLCDPSAWNDEIEANFIKALANSIKIEGITIQMPPHLRDRTKEIIENVIQRCNSKPSELDENARVCYSFFNMNALETTIEFLTVCIKQYPKSYFFYELRGSLYGFLEKFKQGLTDINSAIALAPRETKLLYDRACMMKLTGLMKPEEVIDAYLKFIAATSIDHRKVPESYYSIASCYLLKGNTEQNIKLMKQYYNKGIEAEKQQLSFFLPYQSNTKLLLSPLPQLQSESDKNLPTAPPFDDKKPRARLTDPRRIERIRAHREVVRERRELQSKNLAYISRTVKPRLQQKSPASLIGLKSISLRDMNLTKDHIYQGFVLSVVIFEQSPTVGPSIGLLVEDDNGDLERLFIYNIPASEGQELIQTTYTYGTKMTILNPYLRVAADMKTAIRVDDVSSIILQGENHNRKNMCRCCGEDSASHVCARCKSAHYCSKECQTMDWKDYGHKFICY